MKFTTLDSFDKHLIKQAAHGLPHAYLIVSPDSMEQKKIATSICDAVKHHAPQTEMIRITLESDVNALSLEVQNPSLFSPNKLLTVDGLETIGKEGFETLVSIVETLPDSVRLLLLTKDLKSSPKFYDKLKTFVVMLDLRQEKPWELKKRLEMGLVKTAQAAGKRLDVDAAATLLERCSHNTASVQGQLEKLICYLGDSNRIDKSAVDAFFFETLPFDGWKVTDALLFGKGSVAPLATLTDVGDLFSFFGQLRHRIYTSLQIISGEPPPALKPQIVEKIRPLVLRFTPKYYETVLAHIFDLELKMRQERFHPQDLSTQLLARIHEAAQNHPATQPAFR